MLMTKNEIENAVRVWPANVEAPLTRDEQIKLILTARERHEEVRRLNRQFFKENKMS